MSRAILQFILPFLGPTLLFLAWVWLTRGQSPGSIAERLRKGPWFWLILSGLLLVIAGFGVLAITGGGAPGSHIIAPYMEDGRVVPAQIE